MTKLCGEVFPIKKTSNGKVVCSYAWKTSVKKCSKSVHNYTFYTEFSAPPRLTQMRQFQTAIFPKRLHRFGCAIYRWKGYDALYVVAKFIGKVYHLQGQIIGQMSENSVFGFYYACKAAVSRIYDAWSRRTPASASHCDSYASCSSIEPSLATWHS